MATPGGGAGGWRGCSGCDAAPNPRPPRRRLGWGPRDGEERAQRPHVPGQQTWATVRLFGGPLGRSSPSGCVRALATQPARPLLGLPTDPRCLCVGAPAHACEASSLVRLSSPPPWTCPRVEKTSGPVKAEAPCRGTMTVPRLSVPPPSGPLPASPLLACLSARPSAFGRASLTPARRPWAPALRGAGLLSQHMAPLAWSHACERSGPPVPAPSSGFLCLPAATRGGFFHLSLSSVSVFDSAGGDEAASRAE